MLKIEEQLKEFIKKIFKKFGLDIHKIKFEHGQMDALISQTAQAYRAGKKVEDKKWEEFKKDCRNLEIEEKMKQDPFIHTNRVMFELSNICNYANIHHKCPLSLMTDKIILPAKIVYNVLNTLKKYNFQGEITFHNYNEPLIDPRLFKFIEYTRQLFPKNEIYLCTNGFYLTQSLADELVEAGLTSINVSVYSKKELERLSKIRLKIPFQVNPAVLLDNIITLYEQNPEINSRQACFAPLNELIITKDGEISLCCLDWQRIYTFGNLRKQSLEEIVTSSPIQELYKRLSKGDRFLNICKRCNQNR